MIGGVLFTPEVQAYEFKTCVVEENAITEVKDYSKVANEEVCTYHYYQGELNGIEDVRLAFAKRSGVVIGELWYDETSYSTPVIGFSSQDNENEITFYVSDGITFSSIGMVLTGEMNGNQLVCFDERIQKESKLKNIKETSGMRWIGNQTPIVVLLKKIMFILSIVETVRESMRFHCPMEQQDILISLCSAKIGRM